MLWWPWAWLPSLRCVVSDAGGDKDMRKRERADRGPTLEHGNLRQCDHSFISIRVFFADNFTSYNKQLACHISINSTSRSSLNHSAIIVDDKGHGRRGRHKSYAHRLASYYNKRCVRAYIGNKSFWTRVHWQQKSGRFNFWIGQTFVVLVWTTKDKSFSKS